jgi:hypothetical protein
MIQHSTEYNKLIKAQNERLNKEYEENLRNRPRNKCWVCLVVSFLGYGLLGGLIVLLLWMNGTISPSTSETDYQSNGVGITLLVILGLLSLLFTLICTVWYLVETSHPTFSVDSLEQIVHSAVHDFNEAMGTESPRETLENAKNHFDSFIVNHPNTTDDILIESMKMEMLLDFIQVCFIKAMPELIVRDAEWCYNEVGGVFARQKILSVNFKEYLCIWGTPLKTQGFSGYYSHLNEGDVMIIGEIKSSDPESKLSAVCSYRFGNTSRLANGHRRYYRLSNQTYMISFGLHKKTNMLQTFWPGVIIPYLFFNNDSKSFWIQIRDAWKGIKLWLIYRIKGGK